MIVAIDGPAGSGKSTTARRVAEYLDYLYVDTGAMYRAVALAFLRREAEPDVEVAEELLASIDVHVSHEGSDMLVFLDGEDVSSRIRVQEVGAMASKVSSLLPVREKMMTLQREEAHRLVDEVGGVILDGRDIGTEVLPDADAKIFLIADDEVRARRRQKELESQGVGTSMKSVLTEIRQRDKLDRERAHAPLRKADDAITIDTTNKTIDEQVDHVVTYIRERARKRAR